MAKQTINVGSSANDGTGDPLRTAFNKINANFTELYGDSAEANDILEDTTPQLGGDLDINGHNITSARSNENIRIIPNGTGTVELEGDTNVTGTITATGDIFANGNINLGNASGDQTKVIGVFEADQVQIDGTTITTNTTNGAITLTGNATGGVIVENLTVNDNTISSPSNSDISIQPGGTGDVVLGALRVNGTTLDSSDSTKVTIAEALDVTGAASLGTSLTLATGATVTGILDEDAMGTDSATQLATQQSIKAYADTKAVLTGSTNNQITTVTGANAFQGESNLTFDGTTLAVTGAGTFSTSLGVTGTLTTADITTTGTHTVTGTSNIDYVQIKDNKVTTNSSNANLELSAKDTGVVDVQSAMTTVAQTITGDVVIDGELQIDNISINSNGIIATNSNGGININPDGAGIITLGGSVVNVPNSFTARDLSSSLGLFLANNARVEQVTTNGDLNFRVHGTGNFNFENAQTQMTVGAVGAATHLPLDSANEIRPLGYLKLKLDGTEVAIPYFNVS